METKTTTVTWDPAGASGHRFEMRGTHGDVVPMDAGPEAACSSPVELVLAALGACTGIDVVDILRKKRQAVDAYEVRVEGARREEHPRIFTRIVIVHRLRGKDLDPVAVAHAIELSDTKYCTVHAMLAGPACEIVSRFEIDAA